MTSPLLSTHQRLLSDALLDYRAAWWLKTPFGAETLTAEFPGISDLTIRFDIRLATGDSLASPVAERLRHEIYDFLCIQAHSIRRGTTTRGPATDRTHLFRALRVVDHFLLADKGKLAKYGFRTIGLQELMRMLTDIATAESATEGMYGWHRRLVGCLREMSAGVDDELVAATIAKVPEIGIVGDSADRVLALSPKDLVRVRVALYSDTLRALNAAKWRPEFYQTVNTRLKARLYAATLMGPAEQLAGLRLPAELHWSGRAGVVRERAGVPVSPGREDKTCSQRKVEQYRASFLSWEPLSRLGRGPTEDVLREFATLDLSKSSQLKEQGNFRAVPPPVVASVLRAAIVFFYNHSEHVLQALAKALDVFSSCSGGVRHTRMEEAVASLVLSGDLPRETANLGVSAWSINAGRRGLLGPEYGRALRANPGLLEIVLALYGACLLIVGTFEGARQGELLDLSASNVDETRSWLTLLSRKSGFDNLRAADEIPVPKVAVDVLETLGKFLVRIGAQTDLVFAMPTSGAYMRCNSDQANASIDTFLDFIEAPVDPDGRRYYIRQHQLRRFFANVFFHCCGFAGMDTLRWFMRHVDAEHLWSYIRSTTPGSELHHYFADTSAALVRGGAVEMYKLVSILEQRFGVENLDVVSDAEMHELLVQLQENHEVTFEPIVARHGQYEDVRLGVVVWGEPW